MSLKIITLIGGLLEPDKHAGDRRLFELLSMITANHHVDVWVAGDEFEYNADDRNKCQSLLYRIGIRQIFFGWRGFVKALAKHYYDMGLFEFYYMYEMYGDEFRRRQPETKVVVDTVDVHFARLLAGAEVGVISTAEAEDTRRKELAVYRAADAAIVVTREDEEVLSAEGGMPPLFTIPIVMPVRRREAGSRHSQLLFIGGFSHKPNEDGLRWFVEEIWPHVRTARPDARLTVIGSNAPANVLAFNEVAGVAIAGYVPDTAPYLDRAAISIAPLRFGGGMKGKVVEAMSAGVPVVTTTFGAQGLGATAGEHLMVANDPPGFAQAVISLLQNTEESERMGLSGQQHIQGLCGPASVKKVLDEMLEAVVPRRHSARHKFQWRYRNTLIMSQRLVQMVARLFGRVGLRDGAKKVIREEVTGIQK